MNTGINIGEIKNETLQRLAQEIDASGISKKDNFIDEVEFSIFLQKAQEQKDKFSEKDFAEVMGLFKSGSTEKPQRAKLSWKEIGQQALKSVGKFFKGMFCDEQGFSLKRTVATVGTAAALILAAPAAAALGAGAATVGAIAAGVKIAGIGLAGYMVYNGAGNVIEGTEAYYNADTHEKAQAAMEKAMDGAVETAFALPAVFGIFKGAKKGVNIAKERPIVYNDGTVIKRSVNSQGKMVKEVISKDNQVLKETEYQYGKNGKTLQKKVVRENHRDITITREYSPNGSILKDIRQTGNFIEESTYEQLTNGGLKSTHKYSDGYLNITEKDINGKQNYYYEKTANGEVEYTETFKREKSYIYGTEQTEYFAEGHLTKKTYKGSKYAYETKYEYDETGSLKKEITHNSQGQIAETVYSDGKKVAEAITLNDGKTVRYIDYSQSVDNPKIINYENYQEYTKAMGLVQ